MSESTLSLILTIFIIVLSFFFLLFLILLIQRMLHSGRLVINEQIDTDIFKKETHYIVTLRNTRGKGTFIKNYGLMVHPYHVPLAHPSMTEQASIEIAPHAEMSIDLSNLVHSSLLKQHHGKLYFYYEDGFSIRHLKKTKLWKKFLKIVNES